MRGSARAPPLDEHIGQVIRLDQRGDSAHSNVMTGRQDDFSHLDSAGRATADIARNPRLTVNAAVGAASRLAGRSLAVWATRAGVGRAAVIGAPGDAVLT